MLDSVKLLESLTRLHLQDTIVHNMHYFPNIFYHKTIFYFWLDTWFMGSQKNWSSEAVESLLNVYVQALL